MDKCKHESCSTHYEYVQCKKCGAIKTDSDRSWGLAKSSWFKDLATAEYYKINGKYPEEIKEL